MGRVISDRLLYGETNDESTSMCTSLYAHFQLRSLFSCSEGEVVQMENFTADERQKYFSDLILNQTARPPPTHRRAGQQLCIWCVSVI